VSGHFFKQTDASTRAANPLKNKWQRDSFIV
jgi:hypothetical protein